MKVIRSIEDEEVVKKIFKHLSTVRAFMLLRGPVPISNPEVATTTSCGQILVDPHGETAYTPFLKKRFLIIHIDIKVLCF